MEAISELCNHYFFVKVGAENIQPCIDWAMVRLQLDQEGDDLDITMLAASTTEEDAFPLVEKIIERYIGFDSLDDQLAAGKFIVKLFSAYQDGLETIESLDARLMKLYNRLGYPDWLTMLSRNCEYATDIDVFREPFEHEFAYIAELWNSSATRKEFEAKYSREMSNQHDAKFYTFRWTDRCRVICLRAFRKLYFHFIR
ncbi:MAG TPA: hypothetical protein VFK88_03610 [Gallionella sp.]|nr:hypothetical protein [Gallionella sp.]